MVEGAIETEAAAVWERSMKRKACQCITLRKNAPTKRATDFERGFRCTMMASVNSATRPRPNSRGFVKSVALITMRNVNG